MSVISPWWITQKKIKLSLAPSCYKGKQPQLSRASLTPTSHFNEGCGGSKMGTVV